ncbi:LETM1 domain-containing protein 1-like isoform X2 [Apostichopus japonicus]|uniref:LETM1 domain-containing protein 1-like isoform X2 n=1 Tax=Stichopus japonicus TaxID=307972 RepID=UPI003AB90706
MAASISPLRASLFIIKANVLKSPYKTTNRFILPLLCCRNACNSKNICSSPDYQQSRKLQNWKYPGYKYNLAQLTQCYSSSPSSATSKWAIVRLVQKGGELSEKILYRISPKLHGLYRQFIDGGKAFITDVRFVYRLRGRMREENLTLQDLPWRDIYIKDKVTRDMGKVIPTMIVTWLPFAFYVMLPLIFTFPRQFLSDHFLNKEQLSQFQSKSLKRKRLQEETIWSLIKEETVHPPAGSLVSDNSSLMEKCPGMEVQEVLRLRHLFEKQLRLEELPRKHLVALCKLHSLLTLMLPSSMLRTRLAGKCSVLQAIDFALRRDGLIMIEEQDLKKLCYQRVFDTSDASPATMHVYLNSWLETSAVLKDSEQSLYLHLPLFKKQL